MLRRGDLLPRILTPPPGPRSRELCRSLAEHEAPGINTLYADQPGLLWQEARGANVLDVDGNRYIDLTSGFGVATIGHRHPAVTAAVRRQSSRLIHGLGDVAGHPIRVALAERLCALAPLGEPRVYFAISGSDAVEIALKTVHLSTGRGGILAFHPCYHGLTLGSLAATTRPAFRQPFASHLHEDVRWLDFGCELQQVDDLLAAEPEIGCVLTEPVVGREGSLFPPPGWLSGLAQICRRRGVLLVADEIFTGFGRTGSGFAVEAEGVRPDILCCGKALAGGLPIGAVLGRRQVMEAWSSPGEARHTATFVAHPLSCAAAIATLEVLRQEGLIERAARLGGWINRRVLDWRDAFPPLVEVRGRGMLWGLELASAETASRLTREAQLRGLLMLAGGPRGQVVQLAPPLSITRRQLEAAFDVLEALLQGSG